MKQLIRIFLIFIVLSNASFAVYAPIEIEIIPKEEVKGFLIGRLRTPWVRKLALDSSTKNVGRNIIRDVIDQAARYPLFVYTPNTNPAARLNFTAYLRLLSLRDDQYPDPLFGDFYLLHELHHITTMPYDSSLDYWSWHEKMTLNEKESTLFSEALVHLAFPHLRKEFKIEKIWVDRFLNNDGILEFQFEPLKARQKLLSRFTAIGNADYEKLDDIEKRSWVFDRSNEVWSAIYWNDSKTIESEMERFYKQARTEPKRAASEHRKWLLAHTEEGLPFAKPDLKFHEYYAQLNELAKLASTKAISDQEVTLRARSLVERARLENRIHSQTLSSCGVNLSFRKQSVREED